MLPPCCVSITAYSGGPSPAELNPYTSTRYRVNGVKPLSVLEKNPIPTVVTEKSVSKYFLYRIL